MSVPRRPWIIAHRGAPVAAPENTLPALRAAAALGADAAEVDAQLTRDGVVVLMHDATVDRTTDDRGRVTALPYREIRRLDAGVRHAGRYRGVRVPTLEEAVAEATAIGLRLVVEIKAAGYAPDLVERVAELLGRTGLVEETWLWAFDRRNLRYVGELLPASPRGALSFGLPGPELRREADMLVPLAGHFALLDPRLAERLGKPLINWFVNYPPWAERLARHGASGLITDRPDLLRPLFERPAEPVPIPLGGG